MRVIKDRNAGNGANTYFRAYGDREYCILIREAGEAVSPVTGVPYGAEYARDKAGRVRRFATRAAAEKAMRNLEAG